MTRTPPTRPLPRAKGHPVLGSALHIAAGPHRFVADAAAAGGGIAGFRILHRRFVAISDPELIRHVLVTGQERYRRSFHYKNPVVGQGLLTMDGPVWLKRRRQVNPAFRKDTLQRLVPIVREETARVLQRWEEAAREGRPVPAIADMQWLSVSVSARALLSRPVGSSDAARFTDEIRDALRLIRRRNTSLLVAPAWAPTPLNRGLKRHRDALDAYLRPIIAERRDRLRAGEAETDLLDALLRVADPESGDALSDQEVLDEAKTLFAAGFETTATALGWTLYLLATHPAVADRWREEVDRELGGRPPEWEDLPRVRYTSNLVSESLRLFPPVYNVARVCVRPDVVGGCAIEPGTVVMMSILGVHHDAAHWPEPEAFRPERFDGEWPRRAYLPFATGQHLCIGNNFALTEIAVALAVIAQRFRFTRADDAPVTPSARITLVPDREISLRLEPR